MNIYEIDSAISSILDGGEAVDEETGEVLDFSSLETLQMERNQKIENIGCYVKNLVATASAIKEEEANLAARRKAIENKADRIKDYLIQVTGGNAFKGVRCTLTVRNTPSVNITNKDIIPAEYRRIIPETFEADKKAISAALKAGNTVDGAELVFKQSVTIK